jgi:GT2 family glycosyltransferase
MKIGICIVHYGEQELLDNCLKSLLPSRDTVFSDKVLDCNKDNIGFTAANNQLIKDYLNDDNFDNKPDWLWLLNNDTTVPPETLKAIEEILSFDKYTGHFDPEVGIIGFQIRSLDEPDFIHHAGTGQCFPFGVHKTGSVKLKQFQKRTYEKWVTFASVLIRREVFEKIGLLDENMKFICSDSDFCYRARAAEFKIIYEPSFVIYHKIGQASQSSDSVVEMQKRNDTIYFQNKHINGKLFFDLDKQLL